MRGESWLMLAGVNIGAVIAYFFGPPYEVILPACAVLFSLAMFMRARRMESGE